MSTASDQGCRRAARLLSEQRERRLHTAERLGLRLHLWQCGGCRRFSRQLDLLDEAMQHWRGGAEIPERRRD